MPNREEPTIDQILDALGNKTRRRILELLAEEPRYLLQLARELDVSQQAILKHLSLLEELGLIQSYEVKEGVRAPPRKYYKLTQPIAVSVTLMRHIAEYETYEPYLAREDVALLSEDIRDGLRRLSAARESDEVLSTAAEILQKIEDRRRKLREEEAALARVRQMILDRVDEVIRESCRNALEKRAMLAMVQRFECDIDQISEMLNVRERVVKEMLEELERRFSRFFELMRRMSQ